MCGNEFGTEYNNDDDDHENDSEYVILQLCIVVDGSVIIVLKDRTTFFAVNATASCASELPNSTK
jgi:hypothetical protein